MKNENTPIIVGAGQYTPPKDQKRPRHPLELMKTAGEMAIQDAGAKPIREKIDALFVVNLFSWSYADICQELSGLLNLFPRNTLYSRIGGNMPQALINKAAQEIYAGRHRAVMIAGGEAGYSLKQAAGKEASLNWPPRQTPVRADSDPCQAFTEYEMLYDIFAPAYAYAFFENALRAAQGWPIPFHRKQLSRLCEGLNRVAVKNPHSWSKKSLTADDILTPSSHNRFTAFPYTLRMNANIHVDMAAAVILTSIKEASAMGIDPAAWVYPMGGAGLNNIWHVTQRPSLHDSPAMKPCADLALAQAGCSLADIGGFDLYSCFPWSVETACLALGLSPYDPRGLTVTGGLPYFGGPGNNYALHAIATLAHRIRKQRSLLGLITAMGWYNTKIAVGVYGAEAPEKPWIETDLSKIQQELIKNELPPPVLQPDGRLTIESYIICHDRQGAPEHGTVIGRLPDKSRALAVMDAGPEQLADLETQELIGRTGRVRHDLSTGRNLFNF